MLETFDPITKLLNLMNALLDMADPPLRAFLDKCNILPYYALSWILTWFSHDLEDYHKVVRLFDLFIASPPSMPLYVACAITCIRRTEIMAMDPDFVHTAVTNIPADIDIEATIRLALVLEKKHPILNVQKHSGQWVHENSAANTFETDWAALEYNQEPNHVKIEQYLSKGVPKEEWEDEVVHEMMQRRRASFIPKTL
ncbi:GTPase-activating protein gyp8 [Umbelopsis nana]